MVLENFLAFEKFRITLKFRLIKNLHVKNLKVIFLNLEILKSQYNFRIHKNYMLLISTVIFLEN